MRWSTCGGLPLGLYVCGIGAACEPRVHLDFEDAGDSIISPSSTDGGTDSTNDDDPDPTTHTPTSITTSTDDDDDDDDTSTTSWVECYSDRECPPGYRCQEDQCIWDYYCIDECCFDYYGYYGECCFGGFYDSYGQCCYSGTDEYGACCYSGAVDLYGRCCDSGVIDGNDRCCESGLVGNEGECCDSGMDNLGNCCEFGYGGYYYDECPGQPCNRDYECQDGEFCRDYRCDEANTPATCMAEPPLQTRIVSANELSVGHGVAYGDFDGDTDVDIATIDGSRLRLFDAVDSTTALETSLGTSSDPGEVVAADFDLDGFDDLAVTLRGSDGTQIWVGGASGLDAMPYPLDGALKDLAVGDFDGDGFPDLAGIRATTYYDEGEADPIPVGNIIVYYGQGDGTFAQSDMGNWAISIAPGDFDGDGVTDLAVLQFSEVAIYRGSVGYRYLTWVTSQISQDQGKIFAVDVDGDAALDVVGLSPNTLGTSFAVWAGSIGGLEEPQRTLLPGLTLSECVSPPDLPSALVLAGDSGTVFADDLTPTSYDPIACTTLLGELPVQDMVGGFIRGSAETALQISRIQGLLVTGP